MSRKYTEARVRGWLRANKIFFETIAAFALSLMAVIVSLGQLVFLHQQNTLISLQTRVTEAQALPSFEIDIKQIRNAESGKFDDDRLEVKNDGGAVHDFNASIAEFLIIDGHMARKGTSKIDLPIGGFFSGQAVSAAGKGTLTTFLGYRNNATLIALNKKTTALAQQRWMGLRALVSQDIFETCVS